MPNGRRSYLDTPYGQTTPDLASVSEFVEGYQAQQSQTARNVAKAAVAGLLVGAAVSSYSNYKAGPRPRYILGK